MAESKRYTKANEDFVRGNFNSLSNEALGKMLGRTPSAISAYLVALKLKRSSNRKKWTREEIELFRRKYSEGMTIREIAVFFHTSPSSAKAASANYNIRSGRTGCFPKGNRPWNFRSKGLVKSTPKMQSTQFKKGGNPKNTLHDGAITIRLDHPKTRKGRAYKWIRVSEGKWVHYHKWKWEQKNGPVPPKHMVIFKDGDTMNTEDSNLKLITMAENARRNYNPTKAQQAAKNLSDNYIAGRIANGDKKLREAIKLATPELIEAKRNQLKLKRSIYERDNQTRKTT